MWRLGRRWGCKAWHLGLLICSLVVLSDWIGHWAWLPLVEVIAIVLSLVVSLFVVPICIAGHVVLVVDQAEQVLNDLSQMRLRGQLVPLEVSSLLGFVPVKVGLVDGFLFLDLAKFFDFVMVDHHHLVFEVLAIQILFGI